MCQFDILAFIFQFKLVAELYVRVQVVELNFQDFEPCCVDILQGQVKPILVLDIIQRAFSTEGLGQTVVCHGRSIRSDVIGHDFVTFNGGYADRVGRGGVKIIFSEIIYHKIIISGIQVGNHMIVASLSPVQGRYQSTLTIIQINGQFHIGSPGKR